MRQPLPRPLRVRVGGAVVRGHERGGVAERVDQRLAAELLLDHAGHSPPDRVPRPDQAEELEAALVDVVALQLSLSDVFEELL